MRAPGARATGAKAEDALHGLLLPGAHANNDGISGARGRGYVRVHTQWEFPHVARDMGFPKRPRASSGCRTGEQSASNPSLPLHLSLGDCHIGSCVDQAFA